MTAFVICINNAGVRTRLKMHVVYKVVMEWHGLIEVVDETGSPTLFMAKRFVPVEV